MQKPTYSLLSGGMLICALALIANSGCNSTTASATKPSPQAQRMAELATTAQQPLPPVEQTALMEGRIARGQSPELVYVALGKPDVITSSADGTATVWTYRNYLPPFAAKEQNGASDNATRKRKAPPHPVTATDPLLDSMQAWQANVDRRGQVMSDPDLAPRAAGQSYADYGRMLQQRDLAAKIPAASSQRGLVDNSTRSAEGRDYSVITKTIDTNAWQEYNESNVESPVHTPATVKLDVVFLRRVVADAIINEAQSAFIVQP